MSARKRATCIPSPKRERGVVDRSLALPARISVAESPLVIQERFYLVDLPKLGIDVDDLRLPVKDALRRAADLRFRVVELAPVGDIAPPALSATGRRHLSRFVEGLGLEIASLTADIPGLRLSDPCTVGECVQRTEQILELSTELNVPVVTASVGALTHPETGEPSPMVIEALRRIGACADARGLVYALRPTRETGERLARVLDELRCPSIGICLDPAALVMAGANPLASIGRWADQITLFHVRDATAGLGESAGSETRLGEGDVDVPGVLAMLSEAEYPGPYILRRLQSQTPAADLVGARDLLLRHLLPN